MMNGLEKFGTYWISSWALGGMIFLLGETVYDIYQNLDQKKSELAPSKLEISLENVNGLGKDTLMTNYRGKTYMMIYDERGNLETQLYNKR